MTVEDIVDRVYRRYLTPAFDQPIGSTLGAAMTESGTSMTVAPFDSLEYADSLDRGAIIEVGYELMRVVSSVDVDAEDDPIQVTVARGVMGTTAAAHAIGDEVSVAPQFPRHDVWLAVAEEVEALHPDLWTVNTMSWSQPPYTLPDDYVGTVDILLNGYQSPAGRIVNSPTGQTFHLPGSFVGEVTLTYAARPIRPTDPSDVLADLNVEDRWADIVAIGAAVQTLTGQNTSDLRADYLTEVGETQITEGVDPQGIETSLRRARAIKLNEERRRLRANTPTHIQMRHPLGY